MTPAEERREGRRTEIIYFFRDLNMPLYLLTALREGECLALTAKERARIYDVVDMIVDSEWSGLNRAWRG